MEVADKDKMRQLAEELNRVAPFFETPIRGVEIRERILHDRLKPLLDAAEEVVMLTPGTLRKQAIDELAAELRNWRKDA